MKRWWRIFWKGLSSLLTPEGPSSVFFSFIQGLAIENTTGKYFIAVPLTGLSLLTFVWILSGPYIFLLFDSERLDTGTMSLASLWQHEFEIGLQPPEWQVSSKLTLWAITSGYLRVIYIHLWSKTSRLWQPELQQEAPTTRLIEFTYSLIQTVK